MSFRKVCLGLSLSLLATLASGQSVSLADLQVSTNGTLPESLGPPHFISTGSVNGRFVPADWFRLKAGISFLSQDSVSFLHPAPEKNVPGSLKFDGASINSPRVLGSSTNLTIFTGAFDDPASGTLLRELLKYELAPPEFHDLPVGKALAPDTDITGTGLAITAAPGNRDIVLGTYAYWNNLTDADTTFTGDIRLGRVGELMTFNAFAGLSARIASRDFTWRGGLSSIFTSQAGSELYAEAGIRATELKNSRIDRNLYFLFEPRLRATNADLALSFFSAPISADSNYLGANVLAGFGNLRRHKMRGGISLLGCIDPGKPKSLTPFTFSVSPFYCIMLSDLVLNVTIVVNPLLLDSPETMGEVQLSLKAVF